MDEERSDIEELTYGMVTAEGKTNFDKFMRYFFVINVSILMYKKASRNTIQYKSSGALKKDPTFGFLIFEYALKN